jgi:hypothetical protein
MANDVGTFDPTQAPEISNPSIPNFDIEQVFNEFGYYPTQAEVTAMSQSFSGRNDSGTIGTNAVAQYVNFKRAQADFDKNDPLTALQTRMNDAVTLQKNQVQGLYGQLQDVLSSAPKLFGELTPDQISTYLAPLKNAFDTQLASVQGTIASRGITGSSTENNALAETGKKFQEQVFSTGLDVGMKSQANKANAIQAQIQNLFGLTGQELGISAGAVGQQSAQRLASSNLIASLPSFLNAQSAQEAAMARTNYDIDNPGFQGKFNQVTGDINTATGTLKNLMNAFNPFSTVNTPFGGGTFGDPNAPQAPASKAPGGSQYAAPNASRFNENASGYNRYQSTGSLFE